jgi:2'-5' RNA ligase
MESLMRLFVAVDLPTSVKEELVALSCTIPTARWVRPEAMHLTLFFLGETESVEAVKTALAAVSAPPFTLTLRGVGHFPPGTRRLPRVLWAGITPDPTLLGLQEAIARALAGVGFPPEERPYHPHLTLARLKLDRPARAVDDFLTRHRDFTAGPVPVEQFTLYSSELRPGGPVYTAQARFPLGG